MIANSIDKRRIIWIRFIYEFILFLKQRIGINCNSIKFSEMIHTQIKRIQFSPNKQKLGQLVEANKKRDVRINPQKYNSNY